MKKWSGVDKYSMSTKVLTVIKVKTFVCSIKAAELWFIFSWRRKHLLCSQIREGNERRKGKCEGEKMKNFNERQSGPFPVRVPPTWSICWHFEQNRPMKKERTVLH